MPTTDLETEIIDFNNFQEQLLINANKFMQEVANINQNLLKTTRICNLYQKLTKFEKLNNTLELDANN